MTWSVTHYTPDDYDGAWALHRKTIHENDGFVKNLSFHSDFRNISQTYEAFFVIRDDNRIVGMVGLKRIDDKVLEVKRLQVASTHQGKGLGKLLMKHAEDYAHKHNVTHLRLDVSKPQVKARNLYSSMGFKVTHVDTQILGPDNEKFLSTYMEKAL
jgi:GNAT superfamily N-acetyltransferase